jgi:hypothetical protein
MFLFVTGATRAQQFENYRPLLDTTLFSKSLGFEKGIAITVPIDWQNDLDKRFPLIVILINRIKGVTTTSCKQLIISPAQIKCLLVSL